MNKRINYFLDAHPKAITLKWIKQFSYRLLYFKKKFNGNVHLPQFLIRFATQTRLPKSRVYNPPRCRKPLTWKHVFE